MTALDPAKTMAQHLALQTESRAGLYSPQRNCSGPCKKRKSYTQFSGNSTMCMRCVRRAPTQQGEMR